MVTVYLAGPIDQAGAHMGQMRSAASNALVDMGASFYDPSRAWTCNGKGLPFEAVQHVNNTALDAADGVLALLPAGIPTIGTPMEIERARAQGKPVAVVGYDRSWALKQPGIEAFDGERSIQDAAMWLVKRADDVWPFVAPGSLQVKRLHPGARLPGRSYDGDAGWDLFVQGHHTLLPGEVTDVSTGVAVAIPHGYYGRIVGRSSTHRKRGLSVVEGIIDAGYRGPLFAGVWNPGQTAVRVGDGDRLAQLIVTQVPPGGLIEVQELPESQRGTNGFGSSGS